MNRINLLSFKTITTALSHFLKVKKNEIFEAYIEFFESSSYKRKLLNPVTNLRWSILMEERCRRAARSTYNFIDLELSHKPYLHDNISKWRDIKDNCIEGHVLEFGVYKGFTINQLAKIFPESEIHGFDSFHGLPEDWNYCKKGTFNQNGKLPKVASNVRLHPGLFEDTLPEWLHKNKGNVSFLNIDCDLYSSTKTVLTLLKKRIVSGTIIHFDEMIGYYGWQHMEYKAFQEFIEDSKFSFEYISYGATYVLLSIL